MICKQQQMAESTDVKARISHENWINTMVMNDLTPGVQVDSSRGIACVWYQKTIDMAMIGFLHGNFADDIFKYIFLNKNVCNLSEIS